MQPSATAIIARIAGPFFLVCAAMAAVRVHALGGAIDEMLMGAGSSLMAGMLAAVIGFVIVGVHNRWGSFGQVVVSLIGWAAAIKGAALMIFPDIVYEAITPFLIEIRLFYIIAAAAAVLGAVLIGIGYFDKSEQSQ